MVRRNGSHLALSLGPLAAVYEVLLDSRLLVAVLAVALAGSPLAVYLHARRQLSPLPRGGVGEGEGVLPKPGWGELEPEREAQSLKCRARGRPGIRHR